MNITILSLRGPTNYPLKGGAREYIRLLTIPWLEQGYKITLICGSEKKYDLPSEEVVDGIKIFRVGKSSTPVWSIWQYYKKYLMKSTDLLIENMVSFPLLTPLLDRKKPNITVVHHLTGSQYFKTQNTIKACLGFFLERVVMPVIYRKVKIFAVSGMTQNELVHIGLNKKNIEIIEPGVDNSYYTPGLAKSEAPLIFYIGRMGGVKKVDHLIMAFKKVYDVIPSARLVIAGPGDTNELQFLAKGLPINFVGFLTDDQKKELYQKAWIFASPSIKEGFGMTYVEANACGTPCGAR